jgi:propanol-preferring alcohol dehydrogenase
MDKAEPRADPSVSPIEQTTVDFRNVGVCVMMKAMVLYGPGNHLCLAELPVPVPGPRELLIRVHACGVCRTDLHIRDGELSGGKLPLILGHEIVGVVEQTGDAVERYSPGARIGVPWLGWTCGACRYCLAGRENLCVSARFTGYDRDGGYANYAVADERFCFGLASALSAAAAAPLLCAGLIGYRSLVMTGDASRLGIYGFGASAHIIIQVARHQGRQVFAFTRPGDSAGQQFALELGAAWAGSSEVRPPVELDAAILFAPVGSLVPLALAAVGPGGTVVCAGIHMSEIPAFPYRLLWKERALRSVANLTRRDGDEFLTLAPRIPIDTETQTFPLSDANAALARLKAGRIRGAAVLLMENEGSAGQTAEGESRLPQGAFKPLEPLEQ